MFTKTIVALFSAMLIADAHAAAPQKEGEPIVAADEVPLGGFPGCSVAPPRGGCDARIVCHGVGTLYGTTGMDLQAATEEAMMEAKNELAKFYSSKQKAQNALIKVREDTQKSTSDGGKAINSSASRLISSVSSSSAEAVLSGVQVLGRVVDTNQQAVTVKIGVSCKSQAAAAKSQEGAARSANPSNNGQNTAQGTKTEKQDSESYRVPPGGVKNMRQEMKNADDF